MRGILVLVSPFYSAHGVGLMKMKGMPICQNSKQFTQVMDSVRYLWKLVSSEWLAHQHRDTLSSVVGHPILTSFLAIADGEAIGRVKFEMTEVCSRALVVGPLT